MAIKSGIAGTSESFVDLHKNYKVFAETLSAVYQWKEQASITQNVQFMDNLRKSQLFIDEMKRAKDLFAPIERTKVLWDSLLLVKEQSEYMKNAIPTIELFKGMTASNHLSDAFSRWLWRKESPNPFSSSRVFSTVELLLDSQKKFNGFANYLNRHQELVKVDYDLSKVEKSVAESGIITQPQLIKEAWTIKKVIAEIYRNNAHLYKLHPREFEEVIAELFLKKGYTVELTKQTRDGGYDIIALSYDNGMPLKYLIECKRYARKNKVGIDVIRSFSDVIRTENANKGIIVTTSSFTTDVRKRHQAAPYILELKDRTDIISWVQEYIITA